MKSPDISNLLDLDFTLKKKEKEFVDQSERKRVDSFFIHQCIIRRFKLNYRDDYDVLLGIRHDIESILGMANIWPVPRLRFELSSTKITLASMSFLGTLSNRTLLRSESSKKVRDTFCKHLNLSRLSYLDIKEYLTKNDLDEIIKVLKKNLQFCEELIDKYNIFDY